MPWSKRNKASFFQTAEGIWVTSTFQAGHENDLESSSNCTQKHLLFIGILTALNFGLHVLASELINEGKNGPVQLKYLTDATKHKVGYVKSPCLITYSSCISKHCNLQQQLKTQSTKSAEGGRQIQNCRCGHQTSYFPEKFVSATCRHTSVLALMEFVLQMVPPFTQLLPLVQ